MTRFLGISAAIFLLAVPATAKMKFSQLSDDMYMLEHYSGLGSSGKERRVAVVKASSLCIAAGYDFFEILEQETTPLTFWESGGTSMRIRLRAEAHEDAIPCLRNAKKKFIDQALVELEKLRSKEEEQRAKER